MPHPSLGPGTGLALVRYLIPQATCTLPYAPGGPLQRLRYLTLSGQAWLRSGLLLTRYGVLSNQGLHFGDYLTRLGALPRHGTTHVTTVIPSCNHSDYSTDSSPSLLRLRFRHHPFGHETNVAPTLTANLSLTGLPIHGFHLEIRSCPAPHSLIDRSVAVFKARSTPITPANLSQDPVWPGHFPVAFLHPSRTFPQQSPEIDIAGWPS